MAILYHLAIIIVYCLVEYCLSMGIVLSLLAIATCEKVSSAESK